MSPGLRSTWADTRLGRLFVAASERGVCFLGLDPDTAESGFETWRGRALPEACPAPTCAGEAGASTEASLRHLKSACDQLTEFAAGQRTTFDLPLHLVGTEFQVEVWQALRRIPFGTTATYGEVARTVGRPRATRAVGMANHRNPVPIVVPCHRVVAANGMGGFGGGVEWKRRLLALEGLETGTLWCC